MDKSGNNESFVDRDRDMDRVQTKLPSNRKSKGVHAKYLQPWSECVEEAREELNVTGVVLE